MDSSKCSPNKEPAGESAKRKQAYADGGEPSIVRRLLEPDLEACERGRQEKQRQAIEFGSFQIRMFPRQEIWREDASNQSRNEVDQKQPLPGIQLRDPAAHDRTDRRCA